MKKQTKNKLSKKNIILIILIITIILSLSLTTFYIKKTKTKEPINQPKDNNQSEKIDLTKVKESYNNYVKITENGTLYIKLDNTYQKESTIKGEIEVELDPTYEITDEYFKLLNSNYYIKYNETTKIENLTSKQGEYKYYKNYIPYNENVTLKPKAKLYVDENNYYEVESGNYPIIIKDTDKYGIEYNNTLVYIKSEDIENTQENTNSTEPISNGLSVLNYHYVVSSTNENGELTECQQTICITDTMFESHIKYLKENNYYGVSMRELELFIDGKIQLPKNSVTITIDDGWYVARSKAILEKYQILGTLFLIGSLAETSAYISPYLEVHSHTWDMHTPGVCPSNIGRGGILCLDEQTILEDLRKSRESLNNTPYFCYPFYDYNERAIELLKKAGFTMAFAGELRDSTVRVGQDKYKIPRYVIVNYTTMNQFINYVS